MSEEWLKRLTGFSQEPILLFLGLLPPRLARRTTLPEKIELGNIFVEYWRKLQGRAWPWRLRENTARLISTPDDESTLLEAGDLLLSVTRSDWNQLGRGLRVEVNVPEYFDPAQLQMTLMDAGADSVFLRRQPEGEMAWSWPLRIALKLDSQLLTDIHPESSLRPLFQSFDSERPPMRANLLLFEDSLSEVTKALKNTQTDSLIVLGGIGAPSEAVARLFSQAEKATGAQGIFVFDHADPAQARNFATGLITNLSHDLPLDSAVSALSKDSGIKVLSWATRIFVEATSVREQGRILARTLNRMGEIRLRLPADAFEEPMRGEGAGARPAQPRLVDRLKLRRLTFGSQTRSGAVRQVMAKDLGAAIADRLRVPGEGVAEVVSGKGPLMFDHESAGAQKLAALASVTAREKDLDAARQEDRHLQARVETDSGRVIEKSASLVPERKYNASVFIGARDQSFLSIDEPIQTPEPPDESPLLLDVVFWEEHACPEPQVVQLKLPARGNSEEINFPFQIAKDQTTFSARIAVYHRNRNLQTGLLQGRVGNEPADLTFTLDATPVQKYVGLAERAGIDASFIFHDDGSGSLQAYAFKDGEAAVASVSDEKLRPAGSGSTTPDEKPQEPVDLTLSKYDSLEQMTEVLGRAITRITTNPEEYSDLDKEGSRTLLVELAQRGRTLLTRLQKHSLMRNRFDNVRYIQIVNAHVDTFFPMEYLYDGEFPDDNAKLCTGAKAAADALTSGTCCGAYDINNSQTVCPLRFWSLSKVIERHAHKPENEELAKEFQLRSDPVSARDRLLDPLAGAVFGASKDANAADKDTLINLARDLDAVLRSDAVPSTDWQSWVSNIEKTRPKLLVLLPHHEQVGKSEFLEVGGDKLKSGAINAKHVRATNDTNARPIVLLIGCDTNSAKINLENLVISFQDAGAVIIVSTIATILGRHAGPTAAAIVQELKRLEANPNATFGEVMLAVRRRLLAAGIPMVLGLTSYGDADWRIGSAAN